MATFAQLVTNIADWLSRADLSGADGAIERAIRRSIKHYEATPFWFNEASDVFLTADGTASYTLTNTFGGIHQIIATDSGANRRELNRDDSLEISRIDIGTLKGTPLRWGQYNNLIRLYPVPDRTYTVSYDYTIKPATLSATSDTNAFTTNAEDLIEARAIWQIASLKLRNYDLAASSKVLEQEALRRLKAETSRKIAAGRLKSRSL